MELMEKAYYLTKEQMAVLLSSKNCNSLNCLDVYGENAAIDDNSACMSLFHLLKGGMVVTEGDAFRLSEEMDDIISVMINAGSALVIYTADSRKSNTVLYKHKDAYVLSQSDVNRKGCLRVSCCQRESVLQRVKEILEENKISTVEDMPDSTDNLEDIYIMSLMMLNCEDDFENLYSSKRCRALFDFIDLKGDISYKKAAVVENSGKLLLGIWNRDTSCFNLFDSVQLMELIKNDFMEDYL